MGTTVGSQAGIFIGVSLGGILGFILMTIISTLTQGEVVNSSFNRLLIFAFSAAGALIGVLVGRRVRAENMTGQRTKGNPDLPRRFQLLVEGSDEDISKAREILG
jgi:hypothetical protein